jgi:hypothetical protein
MNIASIVSAIDQELATLTKLRELLASLRMPSDDSEKRRPGRPKGIAVRAGTVKRESTMSPEARARISAAQKKRWAKVRKG